ncbi:MAG: uncharacterized protein JWP01_722 [Myxococcales bacterium]|nr:uncharacterized protein [Myxococcales bacterium]
MRALWSVLALFACSTAEGQAKPQGPLVLELFTSQGCSSCPPADRLLAKLAKQGVDGRTLAPISFHVDYWDDLGWPDPHASPAWTQRQREYAASLGDNRVYTPELVVGGSAGMVGSNLLAITTAIAKAPRPALLPATVAWSTEALEVTATAPADADVIVVVWEDAPATKVKRGENAGETLGNDRVARRLQRVAMAGTRGMITVTIDPTWRAVGAVAFAQRTDGKIVASALLPR